MMLLRTEFLTELAFHPELAFHTSLEVRVARTDPMDIWVLDMLEEDSKKKARCFTRGNTGLRALDLKECGHYLCHVHESEYIDYVTIYYKEGICSQKIQDGVKVDKTSCSGV